VIVLDNHKVLLWILFFCKLKNKRYIPNKPQDAGLST
jgi:hypothetical protein